LGAVAVGGSEIIETVGGSNKKTSLNIVRRHGSANNQTLLTTKARRPDQAHGMALIVRTQFSNFCFLLIKVLLFME
jgi:hypothetical protein